MEKPPMCHRLGVSGLPSSLDAAPRVGGHSIVEPDRIWRVSSCIETPGRTVQPPPALSRITESVTRRVPQIPERAGAARKGLDGARERIDEHRTIRDLYV